MTKVIVLSTVLGLSALGMACGDSGTNVNVNAKPSNSTNTVTPANTMAPANTTAPSNSNMTPMNSNMKPANSTMAPANSNMKPANAMKTPMPSPTKKP